MNCHAGHRDRDGTKGVEPANKSLESGSDKILLLCLDKD